jgi:PKD repeat protein
MAPAEAPVADFMGDPTDGVRPLEVSFTNQSTGAYDTCSWTFGDSATSTSCSDPIHTYTTAGIYTVSLTVSGLGGSDSVTNTNYITVYEPVEADFTAAPTAGFVPMEVHFSNISTGDFTESLWSFGDESNSTAENPSHTYTIPDTYSVTLTVSGPGGRDTFTRTNYISASIATDWIYLPAVLRSSP